MSGVPWDEARGRAFGAVRAVPARVLPLGEAAGAVLAEDARSLTDLPVADVSAMDGWAVRGPAPWRVVGEVLAGQVPGALDDGQAVRIATGALLPAGADGVLRREWAAPPDGGRLSPDPLAPEEVRSPGPVGIDVRRAGEECVAGQVVLAAGTRLTPAGVGLLAAAGLDTVPVRRPVAELLVLGDELVRRGRADPGRPRDALGPLLTAWLAARGAAVMPVVHLPDEFEALSGALAASTADVLVSTGSTARGPVDHLHAALTAVGARPVVDGVAVRPGHPQLLALLPGGRPLIGLPGNPLAAVSGVLTLLEPVLAALAGSELPALGSVLLAADVPAGGEATRLIPVSAGHPMLYAGPAMLRGLATADALAVVPPGGAKAGDLVDALPLP